MLKKLNLGLKMKDHGNHKKSITRITNMSHYIQEKHSTIK